MIVVVALVLLALALAVTLIVRARRREIPMLRGGDLDRVGLTLYNVERVKGESDKRYRARLGQVHDGITGRVRLEMVEK